MPRIFAISNATLFCGICTEHFYNESFLIFHSPIKIKNTNSCYLFLCCTFFFVNLCSRSFSTYTKSDQWLYVCILVLNLIEYIILHTWKSSSFHIFSIETIAFSYCNETGAYLELFPSTLTSVAIWKALAKFKPSFCSQKRNFGVQCVSR